MLLIHTSKYGSSVLITSPSIKLNLFSSGLPCTLLVTSAAIRGSISTAMTLFALSRILTVKFPDPGPTSKTTYRNVNLLHLFHPRLVALTSLCLRSALSTIACAIPGFLRICWPMSLFSLKMLFLCLFPGGDISYGLLRLTPFCFAPVIFPMLRK